MSTPTGPTNLETIVAPWESAGAEAESEDLQRCLLTRAMRCVREGFGLELVETDPRSGDYAARLWRTVSLHLKKQQMAPSCVAEVEAFIARIEAGKLHYGSVAENVIHDVMVAQGLELHENAAAEVFQRSYLPGAKRHAERFAGPRGVDAVENLAAELVLPRRDRPPKIATYQGMTPLGSWLRSVVVNQCVSRHRAQKETSLGDSFDVAGADTVATSAFAAECEPRLAPSFRRAVEEMAGEDRVLLKMLILDGASQKALAEALGVNSGTLTRRKQKAATGLFAKVKAIGAAADAPAAVRECLEILLAGDVAALQKRLASLLAFEIGRGLDTQ